jgi:hypothetical protein
LDFLNSGTVPSFFKNPKAFISLLSLANNTLVLVILFIGNPLMLDIVYAKSMLFI